MKHTNSMSERKNSEEDGKSSISLLLNSEHNKKQNIKHLLPGRGKRASLEVILHLSCSRIEAEKHELILRGYLSAAGGFSPRPLIRSRISAGGIHGLRKLATFCSLFGLSVRQRERQMRGFKSSSQAQRFLSAHGVILNLFRVGHNLLRCARYRVLRSRSLLVWHEVTCVF